jgi:type II secretory pathway predicted ATPase ExeA
MRVEVMQHFGLTVPLSQAGYYETAHHKDLMKDVRGAINEGRLIAICGVIGSGKTVMLRRLQQVLEDEKKVTVSKSLAIEKHQYQAGHLHRRPVLRLLDRENRCAFPPRCEKRSNATCSNW